MLEKPELSSLERSFNGDHIAGLPEKYREEILRQYELPEVKATFLDILRWAKPFEVVLMVVGILLAIASGFPLITFLTLRGRFAVDHNHHGKPSKRVWRICNSGCIEPRTRPLDCRIQ